MRISDWSSDVCSSDLYREYLTELMNYLVTFFKRAQPLFNLEGTLKQFEEDFTRSWEDGSFVPVGYSDEDRERDADRKSVVEGKSVSVRVDLGGRRIIEQKKTTNIT